ncbi:MAG: PLP-dependent aminotransferase family protein [Alphaproteobacteria bacterium]|nr:PLP-dependent aminotransferase family protein [Alphaproteobacteria bacterium]
MSYAPEAELKNRDWEALFAHRAERMRASEIRELLKLLARGDIISFAGGIPDPALFPMAAMQRAHAEVLGDPALGSAALQYSVSEGYPPLRAWIVSRMARLGIACDIDNVMLTSGSQQALDLLAKLFLGRNDTALVTKPTYLGALQAFNTYEPRFAELKLDGNMTPAAYREEAAAASSRLAMAYVVSDFANPTGISVPRAARERLLDAVADLDIPLIEDTAYEALGYDGAAVPSCLALDVARRGHIDSSRVIYCGTFSKTIAPGLRLGWICAAHDLVKKAVLAKQATDLHSSSLNQVVMHRVVTEVFERQVSRLAAAYAKRRDAMLAALERHMPEGVSWTRPGGGMFVWVTLPEGLDGAELLAAAIEREKVAFVPGKAFYFDGTGANHIRLSFSLMPEDRIEEGIARLGRVIKGWGK